MGKFPAVIDTDSLSNIVAIEGHVTILLQLRLLFSALHVPQKVKEEFLDGQHEIDAKLRQRVLAWINGTNQFWIDCHKLDKLSTTTFDKHAKIHAGEKETFGQYKAINATYIISDDKDFKKLVETYFKEIKILNTIHILCYLHVLGYIDDWKKYITVLHRERPFKEYELKTAYEDILSMLRLNLEKRDLHNYYSFKKIGL